MNTQELEKNIIAAREKLAGFVVHDEARTAAQKELKAAEDAAQALTDRINSSAYKADVKRADKLEAEMEAAYLEAAQGMEAVKATLDKAEGKHNEFKVLLKTLDGYTRHQQDARIHGSAHRDIVEMQVYVNQWLERRKVHAGFKQMGKPGHKVSLVDRLGR